MRTASHSSTALALALLFLTGCGSDDKGRNNASAPQNNVQDNVQYLQTTDKELRDTAKAHAKQANDIMDERWKAKK